LWSLASPVRPARIHHLSTRKRLVEDKVPAVKVEGFEVDTRGRLVTDITDRIESFCGEHGGNGLVHVFLPHATAGLALMESGSGSELDLEEAVDRLLPKDDRYRHRHGSPGHGGDHLLPVFVSPSVVLPVDDGRLSLGTWQRVVIVDPNRENNRRSVQLRFVES
jgi:secondary thiamine-phosphate synthase enzyme